MAIGFGATALAQDWDNQECLDCHAYEDILEIADNPRPGLVITPDALEHSVHVDHLCIDCHEGLTDLPHDPVLPDVGPDACGVCHDVGVYLESAHGAAWSGGDNDAPTCANCHGTHDIHLVSDPDSLVYPLHLPDTCGACHADQRMAEAHSLRVPDPYQRYITSVHGQAVTRSGLLVAATCTDCHGSHDIWPEQDPRSRMALANIPDTCGQCHTTIPQDFAASIHGQLLAAGRTDGPTCTTCHSPHDAGVVSGNAFAAAAVAECRNCHAEKIDTYRGTYHGKVNELGYTEIAACTSCHTAHHILPASDAASSVAPGNVLATCQQCHTGATEGFVGYSVHADPTDFDANPFLFLVLAAMTTLLSSVMLVSLTHTALWYRRLRLERLARGKRPWTRAARDHAGEPHVERLSSYNRFLHILVMSSFFLLVLTGMPLHFAEAPWAQSAMRFFGGFKTAAFLHRVGAVITLLYALLHVGNLGYRRWVKGERGIIFGPDTLVPRFRDLQQIVGHFKWFFGKGPRPDFGRWTYWEKFDYFAVFFGINVIGSSGLVLWFPEFFTRVLPGWVINVATIVHSDEALLAMSFIFTVHFFNAHLRPGKFPIDPVFLTGRTTVEELQNEHPAEYRELVESGRLEESIVEPASPLLRHYASVIGYPAAILGVVTFLVVALTVLAHLLA